MKKENCRKSCPKKTWLLLLLLAQAVIANAIEGIVLRTISSPTESRVMLDTTGDGRADMYVSIPRNVEPRHFYDLIRGVFEGGTMVEVDDDYILSDGNMNFSYLGGVLSTDGISTLDTFGAWDIFEAAAEKRRAAARNTR